MNELKDIVVVLSDQHAFSKSSLSGFDIEGGLSELSGTNYTNTYCNAPLCVPSRMSFLTGKLPRHTEVFDNDSMLSSDVATMAHALGAKGYKTILVGRMHFKGVDQNHGFDQRLVGDITSQYWGVKRDELGSYAETLKMKGCQNLIGPGYSPVHEYDQMVYEEALRQLSMEHDSPLFIVVGFYSPHFPYIGHESTYNHHKESYKGFDSDHVIKAYEHMVQESSEDDLCDIHAAYCSMCEHLEHQVAAIHNQFENYLNGKDGLFIYTSDHGDQLGNRGLFGKKTFYSDSIKVPLLIKEMHKNIHVVRKEPVSLIDITKSIVSYSGAYLPDMDGEDIISSEKTKPIIIEQMFDDMLSQCILDNQFKALKYGEDLYLLNHEDKIINNDEYLEKLSNEFVDETTLLLRYKKHCASVEILKEWGQLKKPKQTSVVDFSKKALTIEKTLKVRT